MISDKSQIDILIIYCRNLADTTIAAQTLTETSTYSDMTTAVTAVSDAITANLVEVQKLTLQATFSIKKGRHRHTYQSECCND